MCDDAFYFARHVECCNTFSMEAHRLCLHSKYFLVQYISRALWLHRPLHSRSTSVTGGLALWPNRSFFLRPWRELDVVRRGKRTGEMSCKVRTVFRIVLCRADEKQTVAREYRICGHGVEVRLVERAVQPRVPVSATWGGAVAVTTAGPLPNTAPRGRDDGGYLSALESRQTTTRH
jgi:hypothetical protein